MTLSYCWLYSAMIKELPPRTNFSLLLGTRLLQWYTIYNYDNDLIKVHCIMTDDVSYPADSVYCHS